MKYIVTFLKLIIAIVLIALFIVLFVVARNFGYVENVEISICETSDKCDIVEAYRFETNEIRKLFALMNIYSNHNIEKEFDCHYKMVINEEDILCYDGGKYALFKQRIETINDIKEKVKEKDVEAKAPDHYKDKIIVINKKLAKLLVDLGEDN